MFLSVLWHLLVGWQEGHPARKNLVPLIPRVSNKCKKETEGQLANEGDLETSIKTEMVGIR